LVEPSPCNWSNSATPGRACDHHAQPAGGLHALDGD
jgi:hypothetical protein